MNSLDKFITNIQHYFVNPANTTVIVTVLALIIVATIFIKQVRKPLKGCIATLVVVALLNFAANRGVITYIYDATYGSDTMKQMQHKYDDTVNKKKDTKEESVEILDNLTEEVENTEEN